MLDFKFSTNVFIKDKSPDTLMFPPVAIVPTLSKSRPYSQAKTPASVSRSPALVPKAPVPSS